jgi:hypothetical protein
MKTISKFSIFSLLLSFGISLGSTSAFAERTVGNGGGLAEMRAIYLHQHLGHYLLPCVRNSSACDLKAADGLQFSKAVKAALKATPAELVIDHAVSAEQMFTVGAGSANTIRLSPYALYERSSGVLLPKSSAEIAGILLAAFWTQASQISKSEALEKSQTLTARFEETSDQLEVMTSPSVVFHSQRLRLGAVEQLVLLLEGKESTVDVSSAAVAALTCGAGEQPAGSEIQNLRAASVSGTSATVLGDVVLDCAGGLSYKTLIVRFEIDAQGEVAPKSLAIRVTDSL